MSFNELSLNPSFHQQKVWNTAVLRQNGMDIKYNASFWREKTWYNTDRIVLRLWKISIKGMKGAV